MEDIIIICAQLLCELVLNFFSVGADLALDFGKDDAEKEVPNWWMNMLLFILAGLLGWLSTLIFTHSFLPSTGWRLLNVLLSPWISAFASQAITRYRIKAQPALENVLDPRTHFWRTFWCVLGFAVVRFAYVTRV